MEDNMIRRNFIIFIFSLFIASQPALLHAEQGQHRGKVLTYSGDVEVLNASGEKRQLTKKDEVLNEMDTVVTGEGARVVMQFDDGTLSSLDEKSRLRIEKSSWFSYLGGKIYFTFKKVFGEPRRVRTRVATIGVRGTTFIISEDVALGTELVALKEGRLQIESTGPAFEIHRKKITDEFDQFRQQHQQAQADMQKEFEQYRQQVKDEFIEYRRSFTLQADRQISLSGYRVDETALTEANKADFESFESDAEVLIKNFRSGSKGLIAR